MRALVPLANGFEEIEFSTIVDVLRRAGIEVTSAGLNEGYVEGAHAIRMIPDSTIDMVNISRFDMIVLPGGNPGYVHLGEDPRVLRLAQKMYVDGKFVAAICGAPEVLSKAGILKGKSATIYPANKAALLDAQYIDACVVVDGKIITSQGPATSLEFSLKLVELLAGKSKMTEVARGLLVK